MKKSLSFMPAVSFALALLVLGCGNPAAPDETGVVPPGSNPPSGKLATVIIPLPSDALTSRMAAGVPIKEAKDFADRYEVFFTNKTSGTIIEASAEKGSESITIKIPEGSYDILLLATNSTGGWPLLVASSYAVNKPISLAGTNVVVMTMTNVHLEIITSAKVPVLSKYDVGFTFNAKNPLIPSPSYISYSVNNVQSFGQSNEWNTFSTESGMKSYGYDTTLVAPLTTGMSEIVINSGSIAIKGEGNSNKHYAFADGEHLELGKYFRAPIEFVSAGEFPELVINIVWPDSEEAPPPRPLSTRITLTGFNGYASLSLLSLDGKTVAHGSPLASTEGVEENTTFTLRTGSGQETLIFTGTGEYKVLFSQYGAEGQEYLEYSTKIDSGNNFIPFSNFKKSQIVRIHLYGVPKEYDGLSGMMALLPPGANDKSQIVGHSNAFVTSEFYYLEFLVDGAISTGDYDILLGFGKQEDIEQEKGMDGRLYRAYDSYISEGVSKQIYFSNFNSIDKLPWE